MLHTSWVQVGSSRACMFSVVVELLAQLPALGTRKHDLRFRLWLISRQPQTSSMISETPPQTHALMRFPRDRIARSGHFGRPCAAAVPWQQPDLRVEALKFGRIWAGPPSTGDKNPAKLFGPMMKPLGRCRSTSKKLNFFAG